jgi:hypothetical protein
LSRVLAENFSVRTQAIEGKKFVDERTVLRQALTFAHSSFLMVLSDRQKENRKAILVQSAAEDSQPGDQSDHAPAVV